MSNELMPFGFSTSFGVLGRCQTVTVASGFDYEAMSRLEFAGDCAQVSFDRGDGTMALCGVTLVSGAQSAVRQGRIVRLDGLGCGVPVELVLSVDGAADDVRVKFVFR